MHAYRKTGLLSNLTIQTPGRVYTKTIHCTHQKHVHKDNTFVHIKNMYTKTIHLYTSKNMYTKTIHLYTSKTCTQRIHLYTSKTCTQRQYICTHQKHVHKDNTFVHIQKHVHKGQYICTHQKTNSIILKIYSSPDAYAVQFQSSRA